MLSELERNTLKTDQVAPGDQELLRDYAASQSEGAFAELARRHVDWVYSAALRQVGNHAAAQDITQAVFIILARKAASLKRETVLAGWLFVAVRYAARDALKIETRRQRREQEALVMEPDSSVQDSEIAWEQLAPCLDEALAGLGKTDRQAVLLRFFEKKAWREVGESLGTNENAARVRVTRALEKLRAMLQRRGVTVPALVLSGLLLGHAVQAAPAGMTVSTTGSAASITVIELVRAAWRRWLWWRALVIASVLLLLGGGAGLMLRGQSLTKQAAITRESHAAVVALDRAFWLDDPAGFNALIHYRNAEELSFQPVFLAYVHEAALFRQQVGVTFPQESIRQRAYQVTLRELLVNQPPRRPPVLARDHATDNSFGVCSLPLVKVDGVWCWDFFTPLSRDLRDERMAVLRQRTELLPRITDEMRNGTLTNAEEMFRLLHEAPP